ncbi:uncharacterized protein MONBRDRAFT_25370 [Monosiga brevicollis MX1]|uniref:Uncharacterized protein n=1 Tax=Monosiga brevicollis TaxID=81824 RepID=A9UZ78_MONBE|nr:uncharacterized protein MONBRDRAFT_25370 [Monosiga brevicollis MX1]EDQ89186.1 predicted protein [Monosiga brevicollis MX1]|eukprot:XP_001745762.1 hypothetical protein [Monosiga brevicollis MX1]
MPHLDARSRTPNVHQRAGNGYLMVDAVSGDALFRGIDQPTSNAAPDTIQAEGRIIAAKIPGLVTINMHVLHEGLSLDFASGLQHGKSSNPCLVELVAERFVERAAHSVVRLQALDTKPAVMRGPRDPVIPDACVTAELRYFVPRQRPSVLIQQVIVHNRAGIGATVNLQRQTALNSSDASQLPASLAAGLDLWQQITADGTALFHISSSLPNNISLSGGGSATAIMIHSLVVIPSDEHVAFTANPTKMPPSAARVAAVIKQLLQDDDVFKRHEAVHHQLFESHLQANGYQNQHYTSAVHAMLASSYYITTAFEVVDLGQNFAGRTLHDQLDATAAGCYNGPVNWDASEWTLPSGTADLIEWRDRMVLRLHRNGCPNFHEPGRQRAVTVDQAFTRMVLGITGRKNNLRISPSFSMPLGLELRGNHIDFDDHVLHLVKNQEEMLLSRGDRLREALYVTKSLHNQAQILGAHASLELSSSEAHYISTTSQGAAAVFTPQESLHMFGIAPETHSFSSGLVALLVIGVVVFHILLARLLCREFCSMK